MFLIYNPKVWVETIAGVGFGFQVLSAYRGMIDGGFHPFCYATFRGTITRSSTHACGRFP